MELIQWIQKLITEEKVSRTVGKAARGRTANFGLEYEFWSTGDREAVGRYMASEIERMGIPIGGTFKDKVKPLGGFNRKVKGRKQLQDPSTASTQTELVKREQGNKFDVFSHARATREASLSPSTPGALVDTDIHLDREKIARDFIKAIRKGEISSDRYAKWLKEHGAEAVQEKLGREPTDEELKQARDLQKISKYYVQTAMLIAAGRMPELESDRFGGTEDVITDTVVGILKDALEEVAPGERSIRQGQNAQALADHYLQRLYYEEDDLEFTQEFHKAALNLAKRARGFVNDLFDISEMDTIFSDLERGGELDLSADNVYEAMTTTPGFRPKEFIYGLKKLLDKHLDKLSDLLGSLQTAASGEWHRLWGRDDEKFHSFGEFHHEVGRDVSLMDRAQRSTDWSSYTMEDYEDAEGLAQTLHFIARFVFDSVPRIEAVAGDVSNRTSRQHYSDVGSMQKYADRKQLSIIREMSKRKPFVPDHKKYEPTGRHHQKMREGQLTDLEKIDSDELEAAFKAGQQGAFDLEIPEEMSRAGQQRFQQGMFRNWRKVTAQTDLGNSTFLDVHTVQGMNTKLLAGLIPALGFDAPSNKTVGLRNIVGALLGKKLRPNDFLPAYGSKTGEGKWSEPFADEFDTMIEMEREDLREAGYKQTDDEKYGVEIILPPLEMSEKNMRDVSDLLEKINRNFEGETTAETGLHIHIGVWDQSIPMTVILSMLLLVYENERKFMQLGGRYASQWAKSARKVVRVLANEVTKSSQDEGDDSRPYTFSSSRAFLGRISQQMHDKFVGLNVGSWKTGTIELRYARAIDGDTLFKYLSFIKSLTDQAKGNAEGFTYDFSRLTRGQVGVVKIEPTTRGGIEMKDAETGEPLWGRHAKREGRYRSPRNYPEQAPLRELGPSRKMIPPPANRPTSEE